MKKLVFDDFQARIHQASLPAESDDESPVLEHEPVATEKPQMSRRVAATKPEAKPAEFQISDFFDLNSDVFKSPANEASQPELRTEFDFLLNKVLAVVKDVVFAHSVAFFWANREKEQMVCEAKAGDSENFLPSRRFPMGHDIVTQIATGGKPQLISHVNPSSERELIPYYHKVEYVKSLVGVPVYYPAKPSGTVSAEPVGVLVVDSTTEDAFGHETIGLLGQFTKLISALIKSSTDKYDLLLDAELLSSIRRLQERIRGDFSALTIAQSLADEAGRMLNWNFLSVVLHDEVKRAWAVKKVVSRLQETYVGSEEMVDFSESVVGRTIKNNTHQVIHDLEAESAPRYYRGEKFANTGSFVSVPISSLNKCYGALNVESRDKFNFSRKDIEILYRLTDNAASALEILYMNDIIKEFVITDDITGVYSKKFFRKRMQEEMSRADDYGSELSFLLLTIDHPNKIAERYGQDGLETVLIEVAKILRAAIRPYDCIGRYDYNRFGVLLIGTAANDAYLWAEKIRKTITSHIVSIDGKNFSVTVSMGVCGALEGMNTDELLDHATAVLHKGMEAGGNTVRVF